MIGYKARVQELAKFYGDTVAVIESEIELPSHYVPTLHSWLRHEYWNDFAMVVAVGYDSMRDCIVITLRNARLSPAMTKEEFLEENPHYSEVPQADATLVYRKLESMRDPHDNDDTDPGYDNGYPQGPAYPGGNN